MYQDFYNTARQRMRTAAVGSHGSEKLADAALLASVLSGSVVGTGGLIDLVVGDTTAFNSGEIPLNYGAMLAPSVGGVLGGLVGGINKGDAGIEEAIARAKAETGSAQDMKAKLKEIAKKEGPAAAQAYFAKQKNMSDGDLIDKLKGERFNRRMAGTIIGSILGAGGGLYGMVDESY